MRGIKGEVKKKIVKRKFRGFISFEGIEGSGKSTQAKLLAQYLRRNGYGVLTTEEPGGTEIGHKIRAILLDTAHKHMSPLTELLLYNASRAQHIKEVIEPALAKGIIVITDRFFDSTVAYQGYGRGINPALIKAIDKVSTHNLKPDITFLLDLNVEEGLKRNMGARKEDRFEAEDIEFHKKVRQGYMKIAREEPDRVQIIDAYGSRQTVHERIKEKIKKIWLSEI
ncbi:MAG TPA: dTMP kinase [Nitrospiraceae bacterium]|nr:dTMP kinase [Nitrospiraceae bacterium]